MERVGMRQIDHFIADQAYRGTSGRFGDVFDPNTGEVQAQVALASAPIWMWLWRPPWPLSPAGPPFSPPAVLAAATMYASPITPPAGLVPPALPIDRRTPWRGGKS
jgi:hypothetical protein